MTGIEFARFARLGLLLLWWRLGFASAGAPSASAHRFAGGRTAVVCDDLPARSRAISAMRSSSSTSSAGATAAATGATGLAGAGLAGAGLAGMVAGAGLAGAGRLRSWPERSCRRSRLGGGAPPPTRFARLRLPLFAGTATAAAAAATERGKSSAGCCCCCCCCCCCGLPGIPQRPHFAGGARVVAASRPTGACRYRRLFAAPLPAPLPPPPPPSCRRATETLGARIGIFDEG